MSDKSTVINVSNSFIPGQDPFYFTLMIWKKSGEKLTNSELNPIKHFTIAEDKNSVIVNFKNGSDKTVKF